MQCGCSCTLLPRSPTVSRAHEVYLHISLFSRCFRFNSRSSKTGLSRLCEMSYPPPLLSLLFALVLHHARACFYHVLCTVAYIAYAHIHCRHVMCYVHTQVCPGSKICLPVFQLLPSTVSNYLISTPKQHKY